jgi:oligopeptide/dipeptide ABC transporter ATP-binding protein
MTASAPLLQVDHLEKRFPISRGLRVWTPERSVRAVDGVSFAVEPGTTFGVVGESGCGKTTVARLLLLLERPTGGGITFEGQPLAGFSARDTRRYRMAVQAVFQDPYSSLNPRMRVAQIVAEPLTAHRKLNRAQVRARVSELLDLVGLHPVSATLFPHEMSGGQRQRVAIARALSLDPRLVVLDEPVSALDVSIRAQIINLMLRLQKRLGVTYLLIAHDLAIVHHMATTTAVMYLGKIVEQGPSDDLFLDPLHPYTKALLSAAPTPDPDARRERIVLQGEVPSALDPPSGCAFHPRCPFAFDRCRVEEPALIEIAPGRQARCHLVTPAGDRAPMSQSGSLA